MTDEQIIKALEEALKNNHLSLAEQIVYVDALFLVNHQKAENERLQKENERWKNGFMGACMLENCKLKDEWKSEAIKEFAERLIRTAEYDDEYSTVFVYNIKHLVKEMTEGKLNG